MRPIGDTISRLRNATTLAGFGTAAAMEARLRPLPAVRPNPGALQGWFYVPDRTGPVPLVVILHGCTQTAAGYDRGAGWSALAERFGFAVLLPEQQRANNPNLCFNWFVPEDMRRDGGEAESIRAMTAAMLRDHAIDPARVFVTGLSAGGAMAMTMLATCPDVFAGGAILAGLPYGTATSVPQAFDRMRGHGVPSDDALAMLARSAAPDRGRWPTLSVWQGTADTTVDASNARAIVGQWRALHGLPSTCDREDVVDGCSHRVWLGQDGAVAIEEYSIVGMGHGTPLATRGETACGVPGPYMLDVGISSTWHIAHGWGLLGVETPVAEVAAPAPDPAPPSPSAALSPDPTGVQSIIETALRSAGLMR